MKTQDIINIANEVYPDDLVHQASARELHADDTLALFIVREIRSVTEGETSDLRMMMLAERAMRTAIRELTAVKAALRNKRCEIRRQKR